MAKAALCRLLLMRSGATEWDALGRVQGSMDLPLSASGKTSVSGHLSSLGPLSLDRVLCAPDEGSRQTACQMCSVAGVRRATVVPELAEMHLGLWEGLRTEELEQRYCRAGRLFWEDPAGVVAPDGEALESYARRVVPAFARVLGKLKAGQNVGLVVRPIALGLIRCVLNSAELSELWSMVKDRPESEWYQIVTNDPRLAVVPGKSRADAAA